MLTAHLVFGSCHHVVEDMEGSLDLGLADAAGFLQQVWSGQEKVKDCDRDHKEKELVENARNIYIYIYIFLSKIQVTN